MQNRDGVGRRSQSYLPTFGRARVDNAARLIHEYRLPVMERVRRLDRFVNAFRRYARPRKRAIWLNHGPGVRSVSVTKREFSERALGVAMNA
jgi:hypothetical protein